MYRFLSSCFTGAPATNGLFSPPSLLFSLLPFLILLGSKDIYFDETSSTDSINFAAVKSYTPSNAILGLINEVLLILNLVRELLELLGDSSFLEY